MATIKAFKAVRPKTDYEKIISELPYDVYNRKEAKEIVKNNPLSFMSVDRAETTLDDSIDTYDSKVYVKAKSNYDELVRSGLLVKDSKESLYLYEITMNGRVQTGVVACASCEEYRQNIIKKHENTRADKERDRINHVDGLKAQTGPIFLAYKNEKILSDLISEYKTNNNPYMDFTSDTGVRHRAWMIDNETNIKSIIDAFGLIKSLYVADGHHRLASANAVSCMYPDNNDAQYFLSVIFPDNELMIMDYNRVVKDLNGYTEEELLNKISNYFKLSEIALTDNKPETKGIIYMFLGDKEYSIELKEEYLSDDPIESLDVSVLQKYLLDPILGIEDPKTDKRIDFIGGIRGIAELRKRINTDSKIAFSMYPTQMLELFNVADAGLLMPPKSTWFEPKLRSGLFIHEF